MGSKGITLMVWVHGTFPLQGYAVPVSIQGLYRTPVEGMVYLSHYSHISDHLKKHLRAKYGCAKVYHLGFISHIQAAFSIFNFFAYVGAYGQLHTHSTRTTQIHLVSLYRQIASTIARHPGLEACCCLHLAQTTAACSSE